MPPRFIFVRHGEAEHNVAFHKDGASAFSNKAYKDANLTPTGIEQAQATKLQLADFTILDVWSSPLTRCIQTAEELVDKSVKREYYLHDNLLECLGGHHVCNERKPKYELHKLYPNWNVKTLAEFPVYWVEREPEFSLHQRMFMFIQLLADIYKEDDEESYILIVSHHDVIRSFTGVSLKNAEYTIQTFEGLCS